MSKTLTNKDWNTIQRAYNLSYVADSEDDIATLPTAEVAAGSSAICVGNGSIYIMNASGEWQKFNNTATQASDNGSGSDSGSTSDEDETFPNLYIRSQMGEYGFDTRKEAENYFAIKWKSKERLWDDNGPTDNWNEVEHYQAYPKYELDENGEATEETELYAYAKAHKDDADLDASDSMRKILVMVDEYMDGDEQDTEGFKLFDFEFFDVVKAFGVVVVSIYND